MTQTRQLSAHGAAPPALALLLLRLRLPPSDAEFVIGDLVESFQDDRDLIGVGPARRRFWREALAACLRSFPAAPHRQPVDPPRETPMNSFFSDLRHAQRAILRAPGSSVLTFLALAIGIGASGAIYSVARPALLAAPPYADPQRLMMVWEREADGARSNVGYLTFADLTRESHALESAAAMASWQPTILGNGDSERLDGQRVSSGFFHVLGVAPLLGRDFQPEEDRPGANRELIIGYGLWQRRFGGDSAIVGRQVPLGSVSYTVVGVLPPDFESLLAPAAQIWAPLGYDASLPYACRTCRHLRMVGRLAPGVDAGEAQRELSATYAALARQFPNEYASSAMTLQSLHDNVTQMARPAMLALLAAVAFVVLIACADAGNLMFGRALRREGEFAIRSALGAGSGRLVRLVLSESLLIAVAAGATGILLAIGGTRLLVQLAPPGIPRLDQAHVDAHVLLFSLALTLVTGLLAAAPSAFAARRSDLQGSLRAGARGMAPATRHAMRGALVVTEVALAVMLLAGATLLFQSLGRLLAVDTGFQPDGRVALEVQVSGSRYADDNAVWNYWSAAVDALRATPGVVDAAVASQVPLGGNFDGYGVHVEDHPSANPELDPGAQRYAVTPGYLRRWGSRCCVAATSPMTIARAPRRWLSSVARWRRSSGRVSTPSAGGSSSAAWTGPGARSSGSRETCTTYRSMSRSRTRSMCRRASGPGPRTA